MSAEILSFTRPHTIAELLAQILIDQGKLDALMRQTRGRDLTDDEDGRWTAMDDALLDNREELRKLVRDRLGVTFEQLSEAGL